MRPLVISLVTLCACQSVDIPQGADPHTFRSAEARCEALVDPQGEWTTFWTTRLGAAIRNETRDDKEAYERAMRECLERER